MIFLTFPFLVLSNGVLVWFSNPYLNSPTLPANDKLFNRTWLENQVKQIHGFGQTKLILIIISDGVTTKRSHVKAKLLIFQRINQFLLWSGSHLQSVFLISPIMVKLFCQTIFKLVSIHHFRIVWIHSRLHIHRNQTAGILLLIGWTKISDSWNSSLMKDQSHVKMIKLHYHR